MSTPLLEIDDLHVAFDTRAGTVQALRGISLSVAPGETLGIVGESGSGKSTLAKLLLALNRPTSGKVLFGGKSLQTLGASERTRYRRSVQAVFQDPASSLNPRMRVAQALGHVVRRHALIDEAEQDAFIARQLVSVGLEPAETFMQRYPNQLSGGQQQRVAIARAMMLQPRIIVADEPLSSLDISIQGQVLDLMRELKRGTGVGYVIISHDLHAMESIADRVAVMHQGKIVEIGPDVFSNPQHAYTKMLLQARLPADPRRARAQLSDALALSSEARSRVAGSTR